MSHAFVKDEDTRAVTSLGRMATGYVSAHMELSGPDASLEDAHEWALGLMILVAWKAHKEDPELLKDTLRALPADAVEKIERSGITFARAIREIRRQENSRAN